MINNHSVEHSLRSANDDPNNSSDLRRTDVPGVRICVGACPG
jgi:hypothetical protein